MQFLDPDFSNLSSEQLDEIDRVCSRFESQRMQGNSLSIEDLCATYPHNLRATLGQELVRAEMEILDSWDQLGSLDSNLQRYPDLTDFVRHHWRVLQTQPSLSRGSGPSETSAGTNDESSGSTHDEEIQEAPYTSKPAREFASRFRILRHLADGGIGSVYVAYDQDLNREVALKELQRKFVSNAVVLERFHAQATITGALEHPNIVPIYATGTRSDGRPYYAMRLIGGRSMQVAIAELHRSRLKKEKTPIDFRNDPIGRDLLQRFIAACRAMAYAHSRAVLHRDLKPGNIMVGAFGETLIVDWGLARKLQLNSPDLMSRFGTVVGTPGYMSPEQAMGQSSDLSAASDVYSLGALLYTLITNRIPTQHTGARSDVEQESDTVDVNTQRSAIVNVKKRQSTSPIVGVGQTDVCIANLRTNHYELSPRNFHPAAMGAGVGSIFIAMIGMGITLAILSSKKEAL